MFVVACTAAATDGDKGGGSGGDGGLADLIQDVAEMSATIAAQQASIVELELFKSSQLCFIGHMTQDLHESAGEVISSGGQEEWWSQGATAGSESDSAIAYDDCF